jgi:Na+-transporting NADH:ubiquinone oxidoreductase subunit NqrD
MAPHRPTVIILSNDCRLHFSLSSRLLVLQVSRSEVVVNITVGTTRVTRRLPVRNILRMGFGSILLRLRSEMDMVVDGITSIGGCGTSGALVAVHRESLLECTLNLLGLTLLEYRLLWTGGIDADSVMVFAPMDASSPE